MGNNNFKHIDDSSYLQIAGIQHFAFCRRQWALIHIEQQWKENYFTNDGKIKHERVENGLITEKFRDKIVMRSLHVISHSLWIQGICDVVEFIRHKDGEYFSKYKDYFIVHPVEYKRGKPKDNNSDILQLVAQTICLEEMLSVTISKGALFYFEIRHRQEVDISGDLKQEVKKILNEMRKYYLDGYTPKVRKSGKCKSCSLQGVCLPELSRAQNVSKFIDEAIR